MAPLGVCSVLFKLYDRLMWIAAERATDPIIGQQFGFAPGAHAMDMTESLRRLLRTARGCGSPLCIASLGMALEGTQRSALGEHAAFAWAIAAVLRELVGQRAWPRER